MMFGKFLSAEEIKAAKAKKKERKDLIFELSQNSIVHKLREDVERLTARAQHWEQEWFTMKKTNEVLSGQFNTIVGADKELMAELYELTKVINAKDEDIEKLTRHIYSQPTAPVQPVTDSPDLNDLVNSEL